MEASFEDPVLLQEFLVESEELLQQMDQDLLELESGPKNQDLVNRVFRALHTIKGTSGFFGLDAVAQVAHRAEDVLSSLRRAQIPFTPRIMDALLAARDLLGKMLADIREGGLKQYALEPLLRARAGADHARGSGEHSRKRYTICRIGRSCGCRSRKADRDLARENRMLR
jgi:chemotaxis protein histidine kinase CheA